jgi:cytochrome c biogenesis protein ResB
MSPILPKGVRKLLRSPRTIIVELLGIALAGVAATVVDQNPTALQRERFAEAQPFLAKLVHGLALDHIFSAWWFLALVAVAASSLAIVTVEQWKRLFREWGTPGETAFRSAPYRREIQSSTIGPARATGRRVSITTTGRLGSLGSPLFHAGLLVVALAGVARMLFGADAAREVWEGARIPVAAEAFEVQDHGLLAAPVSLPVAVNLVELVPTYYPSGGLLGLSARLELGEKSPSAASVAVNDPLDLGNTRVYLTQSFGPAAVLAIPGEGTPGVQAVLLAPDGVGGFSFAGPLPGRRELRVRAPPATGLARPSGVVEVRVLEGDALVAAGRMEPGSALALPDGTSIVLRDVRWWVRMTASRDPTAWPMFGGFAVAILGVVLMFGLVRVDTLVVAEPGEGGEKVTLAMRPQRLAPAFAERFERLVERESSRH